MSRTIKTGILGLMLLQFLWHVYLWVHDFNALTTDEYLRLYFSASWARYPKLFIPGEFLPFYFYAYGSAINLLGSVVWAGRIVTLGFSFLFLGSFYALVKRAFRDEKVALLGLVLVMSSPLFMKISTVPLAEIAALALVSFALLFFFRWSEDSPADGSPLNWNLAISMFALAIGNGFRYECWIVSGVCLLWVWVELFRRSPRFLVMLGAAFSCLLPVVVMGSWLAIGNVYFSNPTRFIPPTGSDAGGTNLFLLLKYPKFFLYYYPFLAVLSVGLLRPILGSWRTSGKKMFLLMSFVFGLFLAFISVKYGQHHVVLPERTLLFLVVFVAPLASYGLVQVFKRDSRSFWRWGLGGLLVVILGWAHLSFANLPLGPLPHAKETGLYLKNRVPQGQNVLVEKTGWDWCVIYVESNLQGRIFFDRRSILGRKMTQDSSVLLTMSKEEMIETFREGKVKKFVLKNPELKKILEAKMNVSKRVDVGEFAVFSVEY